MGNTSTKKNVSPVVNPRQAYQSSQEPEVPPVFRVLSANQRAITFDERVHLRPTPEVCTDRSLDAMSTFQPLQRAATFDLRPRTQTQLLTPSDVMHRRFFNARERRVSMNTERNLFRIAEGERERQDAIVIVDPYSTGMTMAEKVLERGYGCICVYSDTLEVTQERIAHVPKHLAAKYLAIIYHDGEGEREDEHKALQDTAAAVRHVKNVDIVGIFAGAETGVLLADKLSEYFKLTTNGTKGSAARRNKYLMGEKVRAAGLKAVAQVQATKWSQVESFVKQELVPMLKGGEFKVILKPVDSAGSDDVMLCHSMDEVRLAFGNIQGKINGLGLENQATLVQEYLDGTEYVVDTVSRNGVTKVVALWEYDKRAVNEASFVYYGVLLRAAPDGSVLAKVSDYVLKVVNALEIVHGPAHAEVKVVRGEPCLVEIGSRCHGGSGSYLPIVTPCLGYNHVDAALDSYLNAEAFERLPDRPKELKSYGCEAMLVSYETGKLAGYPGKEELEKLPSTVSTVWYTHIGEELKATVDMFTTPGSIVMVHEDEEQLKRDYARIRELERKGLYALEPEEKAEFKLEGPRGTVVVVDPFSTGAMLAHELMSRGYDCICVYSYVPDAVEIAGSLVPEGLTLEFAATVAFEGDLDQTLSAIDKAATKVAEQQNRKSHGAKANASVCAVFAGAETGVNLSDALANALGLKGNPIEHSNARRDKYLMGETLRAAGIRAIKQVKATTWAEAEAFIMQDLKPEPFKVVLKPLACASTEDVVLCLSLGEAKRAFESILGKINGLGFQNDAVLLQGYLEGDEYAIDTVSRNGVTKVVALWEYDKRAVNEASFVYYGVLLRAAPDGSVLAKVSDYVLKVVNALEIVHGPAHAEVKVVRGEPCLVEISSRCLGGSGSYLSIMTPCLGYNHVDAALDSYLNAEAFERLPDRPKELKSYGCEAMLVSYETGKLAGYPGKEELEKLPSTVSTVWYTHIGEELKATVDMFTTPGSIVMVHEDEEQLKRDYARIRELERKGLYALEPEEKAEFKPEGPRGTVVVVDPFSTGAMLAHELMSRGYDCICVYSYGPAIIEIAGSLVPEGLTLNFAATIALEGDLDQTLSAIGKAATKVAEQQNRKSHGAKANASVCAVFAGAETGVNLSDALANALGLKGNPIEHSNARRDKYLMGETLRAAGIRAIKQVKATTWAEAEAFIMQDLKPEPFKVVLKPLACAGTEDVVLCLSLGEAKRAFESILGKINGLGFQNDAVLLQEYLEGDEYAIDTVSRNGEHKVTAIWKYDKRCVNDAAFVYFGMSLVPAEGIVNEMIDYQLQVLDALGICNGPAHGEVKFCRGSPVLIEVGSRCHGGKGAWLPVVNLCLGFNQVTVAADSILDGDAFADLADRPRKLHAYGCVAMLVSYKNGVLKSTPGIAMIEKTPAFLEKAMFVSPGDNVQRTVNLLTTPGNIMLVHKDREALERSLACIRELEVEGLFELE